MNLAMQQANPEDETRLALIDIRTRTQSLYVKAKGRLYDEQSRIGSSSSRERSVASVHSGSGLQSAGPSQPPPPSRGPAPTLPKFSGDPKAWETFRDLFRAVYHDRADMAPVEKFIQLHCALEGEAKEALKGFSITNNDYPVAWQTLLDRFDKPEILATKHVNALFELPKLTDESAQGLQKLYDEVNLHAEAIRALDYPVDWRVHAVRRAMDASTERAWVEETQKNPSAHTYEGLKVFLKHRISTLSTLGGYRTTSISDQVAKRHQSRDGRPARVLATTGSNVTCDLCSEAHFTFKCEKLQALTPDQRRLLVEQHQLCFNCLRSGHQGNSCPSTKSCQICGRRHHTKLHTDRRAKREAPETTDERSRDVLVTKNAKAPRSPDS